MGSLPTYRHLANRDRRVEVNIWAGARQPGEQSYLTVRVRNISASGCKIECMAPLDPALPVIVRFEEFGERKAKIMWSKVGGYGCKFDQKLPESVVGKLAGNG